MPLVSFYTPWKHQKIRGFLMFSGGIKTDQSHRKPEVLKKETLTQVFFIEFCEISKNTLSYRVNSRSPVFLFSIFISIIENVLPGEISNNWKFFIVLVITWPWVAMPAWNFNLFSQDRFQPKITWENQISFRQSGTFFRLVFV